MEKKLPKFSLNNDVFSIDGVFAKSAVTKVVCNNGELQIDAQGKVERIIEY